jgi:hypothetical protein
MMQKVNRRDWLTELADKKSERVSLNNGYLTTIWYVERPLNQVTAKTVLALHDMPVAFSEWWDFWKMRYQLINNEQSNLPDSERIVKVPLITDQECHSLGL